VRPTEDLRWITFGHVEALSTTTRSRERRSAATCSRPSAPVRRSVATAATSSAVKQFYRDRLAAQS
jgi:hypothetical protein